MEYKREQQKLVCLGLDTVHPLDYLPPGKYPGLYNARNYQEGQIGSRVGVTKLNGSAIADLDITSLSRMNDYVNSTFLRFLSAGTNLYAGDGSSYTNISSGFSGDPLSVVPYRPEQSNAPYAYIANFLKMVKVSSSGASVRNIGIFPPINIPTMELLQPQEVSPASMSSASGWANHGTAGGATTGARLTGVTVNYVLYSVGTSGWACVIPTGGNLQDIGAGMRIIFDEGGANAETATVQEVHKVAFSSSNTIAAIQYDSGTTGLCTIQPTSALTGLRRNSLVKLGGSENVRVISVTNAPGGQSSFRCSTNSTFVATDTLVPPAEGNIFIYLGRTHVAGETLTAININTSVTVGLGDIAYNLGSPGYNFAVVNGRPIGPDDYIHVSIKVDDPSKLIEGTLILDVDKGTTNTYATTDGNRNAFSKSFRGNDFQTTVSQSETADAARTKAIQLQVQDNTNIDLASQLNPNSPFDVGQSSTPLDVATPKESSPSIPLSASPSSQMSLGDSQYTEFIWKIADLIRLGSSQVSDLSDVRGLQLRINASDTIVVDMGGIWLGGTYGPDTGYDLTPLIYRCRYRSSVTGAKSLPGPATRSGIQALRQAVALTFTASSDAQVDKIDIERLGASNNEWHYVGTCQNSSPTFTDDQLSAAVVINSPLETDTYQPFPLADFPVTVVVDVAGTSVKRVSGDSFNIQWARGTEIVIDGKVTSLYYSPQSTSRLYIADSLGALTSVTLTINQPILLGQPLPVLWGPFKDKLLGCGNSKATGTVYATKETDPDSAPLTYQWEVVSPTEIMMNGCLYDSRCFAFSDTRFFAVLPNASRVLDFIEVPNGKGLFARWALAVGPKIWFLSSDGIYESDGGTPICISDDIATMFPHGDTPGYLSNGYYPVQLTNPGAGTQAQNLRLCYHKGFLIFDYIDTNAIQRTIVYNVAEKSWLPDKYFGDTVQGFVCHYSDQGMEAGDEQSILLGGSNFGFVHTHEGFLDEGLDGDLPIQVTVRTPCYDVSDQRALKVWGDAVYDIDMKGEDLTVTPYLNNYETSLDPKVYTNSARNLTDPYDFADGDGEFARNLAMEFVYSSSTTNPQLYFWSPSYLARPENTFLRADDWTDGGFVGAKLVRGFLLESDTDDVLKGFNLEGDQGLLQAFTGNFDGQRLLPFAVTPPQIASLLRIAPNESLTWRKFRVSYIYDEYPEESPIYTKYDNAGSPDAKFIQGVLLTALGTDPSLSIDYDGDQTHSETLNAVHSGDALGTKPYSFETPFIAHELRLAPSAPIRIGNVKWVFEPAPELAQHWITQGTSHGLEGWGFLKDGYIAIISDSQTTLTIKVDQKTYVYYIPASSGLYAKFYLIFEMDQALNQNLKGKLFEYKLESSSPFRLFKKDCEFRLHQWDGSGYSVVRPFGGPSYEDGAKI